MGWCLRFLCELDVCDLLLFVWCVVSSIMFPI